MTRRCERHLSHGFVDLVVEALATGQNQSWGIVTITGKAMTHPRTRLGTLSTWLEDTKKGDVRLTDGVRSDRETRCASFSLGGPNVSWSTPW